MYCSKCGAAVVGKYCSCCGTRVRSRLEELRRAERNAMKAFRDACTRNSSWSAPCLDRARLADACWIASDLRYGTGCRYKNGDDVPDEAFDNIQTVRIHAKNLFEQLIDF